MYQKIHSSMKSLYISRRLPDALLPEWRHPWCCKPPSQATISSTQLTKWHRARGSSSQRATALASSTGRRAESNTCRCAIIRCYVVVNSLIPLFNIYRQLSEPRNYSHQKRQCTSGEPYYYPQSSRYEYEECSRAHCCSSNISPLWQFLVIAYSTQAFGWFASGLVSPFSDTRHT
ncbi:hypothetical protein B0H34DRAFT_735418 [Crassisporium funariophilum]|nr:hypothetical protein B0H34DRAFT_735418 [Crassisporium funariophilum]